VSYLTCPACGLTLFDRNPLTSPRRCPRCARHARSVELERVTNPRGRAASLLGREQAQPVEEAE
jgi:predicted Zn-ribbon and HTH transcriptional regulator